MLISKEYLQARIKACADTLATFVRGMLAEKKRVTVLIVMDGGFRFGCDILTHLWSLGYHPDVRLIKVSSYEGTNGSVPVIDQAYMGSLDDTSIILVDDILDSGRTATALINWLLPREIVACFMLYKLTGTTIPLSVPSVIAAQVHDAFVVGYGLDYDGKYRELDYIGVLDGPCESC